MKEAFELIKERLETEIESSDKYIREYDSSQVQIAWNKGMRKCLEIVSEVEAEYGNDVCEWKNEKGMFIQNPHTGRKFSNEPSMKNVYCNTCGKKIKVVGELPESYKPEKGAQI